MKIVLIVLYSKAIEHTILNFQSKLFRHGIEWKHKIKQCMQIGLIVLYFKAAEHSLLVQLLSRKTTKWIAFYLSF